MGNLDDILRDNDGTQVLPSVEQETKELAEEVRNTIRKFSDATETAAQANDVELLTQIKDRLNGGSSKKKARTTASQLRAYDARGAGTPVLVDESAEEGFYLPERHLAVVPDDSAVFYAELLLAGADFAEPRYAQEDPIYTVTPDSQLAISATQVYRVADGAPLGDIAAGPVQAVSPDGQTLYVAHPDGTLSAIDLAAYGL